MSFVVRIDDMNALIESWIQMLATANGPQDITENGEVLQTLNEWPRIKWFYYNDNADGNTLRIYDTEHFEHFGGNYYLERNSGQGKEHFERVILRGLKMWSEDEANLKRAQSLRKRFRDHPAWVIFSARQAPLRPGSRPPADLGLCVVHQGNLSTVDIEGGMVRERRLWYFESLNQLPDFNPRPGVRPTMRELLQASRSGPGAQEKSAPSACPTPAELRNMPREQRQAILAAAAEKAEEDYRTDKELTGFEAFSEEERDDD